MAAPSKNLLDPEICGEDLFAIANRAAELSATMCEGCAAYHFRIPAFRAVGRSESLEKDRPNMVEAITHIWKQRSRKNPTFELVIAGSADTGLLATAAHAVALQGQEALRQTHFTVIDRCGTPLQLCAEFSAQHGLDCSTIQGNLRAVTPAKPADVVVMHSVLRFLSADDRVKFLQHASRWLAPEGVFLISNSYGSQSDQQRSLREKTKDENLQRVEQAIESELLRAPFPASELATALRESAMASLDRDRVFLDPSDLPQLAEAAGLGIKHSSFSHPPDLPGQNLRSPRLLAVLAPKSAAGSSCA
ncbi:MAG: class I SAM-dependent methyltransferase [Aestuariivirga sp.]